MMSLNGVDTSGIVFRGLRKAGDSIVYLAREGTPNNAVLGYVVVNDPLREDAHRVVKHRPVAHVRQRGLCLVDEVVDRQVQLGFAAPLPGGRLGVVEAVHAPPV